jgi:hypothetical protein
VLVFGTQQQTFLLILMEDKLKIPLKGKNKFAEIKEVVILPTRKGKFLDRLSKCWRLLYRGYNEENVKLKFSKNPKANTCEFVLCTRLRNMFTMLN